jgi:hypothetical protein
MKMIIINKLIYSNMINKIHNCNNMDLLKTMPDNYVENK